VRSLADADLPDRARQQETTPGVMP